MNYENNTIIKSDYICVYIYIGIDNCAFDFQSQLNIKFKKVFLLFNYIF